MITSNYKKASAFTLLLFLSFTTFSQVGIGTTDPTNSLDIVGDLRVRTATTSDSTGDIPLVVDGDGIVHRELRSTRGLFMGAQDTDYDTDATTSASNAEGIFKIPNIEEFVDRGDNYNTTTNVFTAPVTGVYEITITISAFGRSTSNASYVTGVIGPDGKWVIRFSMSGNLINSANPNIGYARSYRGVARLTQGQAYSFGVASTGLKLIATPTGTTGSGFGSFFKIELIDNQ